MKGGESLRRRDVPGTRMAALKGLSALPENEPVLRSVGSVVSDRDRDRPCACIAAIHQGSFALTAGDRRVHECL